jgi:hypothetical protein
MSNIADLKAALIVEAANISDAIDKLNCLRMIDSWYDAQVAVDAIASNKLASYSMGGITITKHNLPSLRLDVETTYSQIMSMLGRGGGGLVSSQYSAENINASDSW